MFRWARASVLTLCVASACSSAPSPQAPAQPRLTAPITSIITPVQNPVRALCIDDSFSPTEWFNAPVLRFSKNRMGFGQHEISEQELMAWAKEYYKTKAYRGLFIEFQPESSPKVNHVLTMLLQAYPDMHLRQVEYGFTCPKTPR